MTITIRDLADHLNLAPSTVSKALNDYPHISTKTKQRVLEAARELNYYPSAAARDLRRRKTNRIGFSYGYTTYDIGELASRVINGAVEAAEKADFNVMLYPNSENQLGKLTRICMTREVDGLLLLGGSQVAGSIDMLQEEQIPFVVLVGEGEELDVPFATADYWGATIEAARHLIELGHTRIGYVGQAALGNFHSHRIASYKHALKEVNLAIDETLIVSAGTEPGDGHPAMQTLLDHVDPPTAVLVIHDPLAIECLQAVRDAGLRVPEDVAIIGADNMQESRFTDPPLTTIHPPFAEIGLRAMENLLLQIESEENLPSFRIALPAPLVIRQSTIGETKPV
jgi:LacI family transcriptional regulator